MSRFHQRTAIITGASSGIGEACARQFVAEGAKVVLVARSREPLEALATELGTDQAMAYPCDVGDLDSLRGLFEAAVQRFGSIDILVNNAGFNARGAVEEQQTENLLRIIDINLRAPIALCSLALPFLRKSQHGAIVNVASLAGRFPLPHEATYSASKFGLRAFSFAMAEEMRGSNISVSVVSPGPVETGFILTEMDDVPNTVFAQPMSTAEQIAELVLDCAADGERERSRPAASAKLATLGYLFPGLSRALQPVMEKRGARAKQRYMNRGG